ncbi:MAG: 3'-5' exonuclease, partial [Bacteroidota bacterium]
MNYVIFDLEATCWENNYQDRVQEIIEIGAYRLTAFGEITGEYNRFVKPLLHPDLSIYCRELTSITQEEIDRAMSFKQVIEEFQDWAAIFEEEYLLCSWGNFDRRQLVSDCKLHDLDFEWAHQHINLKSQYQEMKKL